MSTSTVPAIPEVQEIEGELIGGLAGLLVAYEPTAEAFVGTAESDIVAGVSNLMKNLPTVKGLEGSFVGPLEGMFESYIAGQAAAYVAKYGPTVVVPMLATYLTNLSNKMLGKA